LLLLLIAIHAGRMQTAFFRSRALVKPGAVSCTVCLLYQGIILQLHYAILGTGPVIHDWASLSVTLLSMGVVIAPAPLSWRFIEKPFIGWAHTSSSYERQAGLRAIAQSTCRCRLL
jgi:peptidoglycan/LPS O-acetylase OafA/YrhL